MKQTNGFHLHKVNSYLLESQSEKRDHPNTGKQIRNAKNERRHHRTSISIHTMQLRACVTMKVSSPGKYLQYLVYVERGPGDADTKDPS